MENNDMIGAVEEYVLQNTKKRMNAGELKAERIEEHDMLNWVKANRKVLNAGKMKAERVEEFRSHGVTDLGSVAALQRKHGITNLRN